jgi:glycosyltransferase involved in cell wall biosynthesis
MNLEISVVIPYYNRSKTIKRAVDSVVSQTILKKIKHEILIVNDGSNDSERMRLHSLFATYPTVSIVDVPSNAGANHARNLGIRLAKFKYIAFLDSDDEWKPTYLERSLPRLRESDWVCSGFETRGSSGRYEVITNAEGIEDVPNFLIAKGGHLRTSGTIIAKDIGEMVGWDEGLPRFQDLDYAIRLFFAGYRPAFVCDALTIAYKNEGNRISNSRGAEVAIKWIKSLEGAVSVDLINHFLLYRVTILYAEEGSPLKAILLLWRQSSKGGKGYDARLLILKKIALAGIVRVILKIRSSATKFYYDRRPV